VLVACQAGYASYLLAHVHEYKTPAFHDEGVVALFSEAVGVWEAYSSVRLPVPDCLTADAFDPIHAKEFCVGLLENPDDHTWSDPLARCPAAVRFAVGGGLFLFRKCLPVVADEDQLRREHRERLCTNARVVELPPGYLRHVRKVARECFPWGWDHSYQDLCWSSCPSTSSCSESSRGKGGSRALAPCRQDFLNKTARGLPCTVSNSVRYHNIRENGKDRGVTIPSAEQGVLRPLHKALYNQLSRLPWLLRGEATPGKLDGLTCAPGQVFVSGDYEAATDHLPTEVSEAFLQTIRQTSCWIPHSVWEAAMASLRCDIWYEDCSEPFVQKVGQLMGNLVSFPLLCLQNYAAFRWVFPREHFVKINGDDIVFRSTRDQFQNWADFIGSVGLRLSVGKTLLSSRGFSINSSFFWARRDAPPRKLPTPRFACLSKPVESFQSLRGGFRALLSGLQGVARERASVTFLRWRRSAVLASGRSVRFLGIIVPEFVLAQAGLLRREQWYLETLSEEQPLPTDPSRLQWARPPAGWRRVPWSGGRKARYTQRQVQASFYRELVNLAWQGSPAKGAQVREYKRDCRLTGNERAWQRWRKGAKRWKELCHLGGRCPGGHCPCHRYRVGIHGSLWNNRVSGMSSALCGVPVPRITFVASDGGSEDWTAPPPKPNRVWAPVQEDGEDLPGPSEWVVGSDDWNRECLISTSCFRSVAPPADYSVPEC
jgi:hypothetical protein